LFYRQIEGAGGQIEGAGGQIESADGQIESADGQIEGAGGQIEKANEGEDVQLSIEQLDNLLSSIGSDLEASEKLPKIAQDAVRLSHESGKTDAARDLLMRITDRALSIKDSTRYKKVALVGIATASRKSSDSNTIITIAHKLLEGVGSIEDDAGSQAEILNSVIDNTKTLLSFNDANGNPLYLFQFRALLLKALDASRSMLTESDPTLRKGSMHSFCESVEAAAAELPEGSSIKQELITRAQQLESGSGFSKFAERLAEDAAKGQ
jgi:hypothetical protein